MEVHGDRHMRNFVDIHDVQAVVAKVSIKRQHSCRGTTDPGINVSSLHFPLLPLTFLTSSIAFLKFQWLDNFPKHLSISQCSLAGGPHPSSAPGGGRACPELHKHHCACWDYRQAQWGADDSPGGRSWLIAAGRSHGALGTRGTNGSHMVHSAHAAHTDHTWCTRHTQRILRAHMADTAHDCTNSTHGTHGTGTGCRHRMQAQDAGPGCRSGSVDHPRPGRGGMWADSRLDPSGGGPHQGIPQREGTLLTPAPTVPSV